MSEAKNRKCFVGKNALSIVCRPGGVILEMPVRCTLTEGEAIDIVAEIVRAVNAHAALLAVAKSAAICWKALSDDAERDIHDRAQAALNYTDARAAIALAEKGE